MDNAIDMDTITLVAHYKAERDTNNLLFLQPSWLCDECLFIPFYPYAWKFNP